MEKIFFERTGKIRENRERLEKSLNVKIKFEKGQIEIGGKSLDVYTAKKVLEALSIGFSLEDALLLKKEDHMLEKLNLKDFVRTSQLRRVKGRVIGAKGKSKKVISELTDTAIVIRDYDVVIIGRTVDVDITIKALRSLIRGAPHSKVYSFLERSRKLREVKKEEEEAFFE